MDSVPISALPDFIDRVTLRLQKTFPRAQVAHCGHVGDGNVHVIIVFPHDIGDADVREAAAGEANTIVHQESVGDIAETGTGLFIVDGDRLFAEVGGGHDESPDAGIGE